MSDEYVALMERVVSELDALHILDHKESMQEIGLQYQRTTQQWVVSYYPIIELYHNGIFWLDKDESQLKLYWQYRLPAIRRKVVEEEEKSKEMEWMGGGGNGSSGKTRQKIWSLKNFKLSLASNSSDKTHRDSMKDELS